MQAVPKSAISNTLHSISLLSFAALGGSQLPWCSYELKSTQRRGILLVHRGNIHKFNSDPCIVIRLNLRPKKKMLMRGFFIPIKSHWWEIVSRTTVWKLWICKEEVKHSSGEGAFPIATGTMFIMGTEEGKPVPKLREGWFCFSSY